MAGFQYLIGLVIDAEDDFITPKGEGLDFAVFAVLAVFVGSGHKAVLIEIDVFQMEIKGKIAT